jgi:hypothetical protein
MRQPPPRHRPAARRRASALARLLVAALAGFGLSSCGGSAPAPFVPPPSSIVGITHTQDSIDDYPRASVRAATALLAGRPLVQNQYLMGWGVDNPEPSRGVFNWTSLDRRMALIEKSHGIAVLTLAGAPDWMKGGAAGDTDWSGINIAPTPDHYGDFAALAGAAALRYPQVRYFQVWSELKSLYDSTDNRWDYEHYTDLYNAVYDAVKKVRPDALIGGPYVALDTWSDAPDSPAPSALRGPWGVVDQRALDVIDYWDTHRHGADFLVVDGSTGTRDSRLVTDAFAATAMYTTVTQWLVQRTRLPVWWAEFYPDQPITANWTPDSPQLAALTLDAVASAVEGGSARILLWQPQASADLHFAALWTEPSATGDAQLTPLALPWQWLAGNLTAHTTIVRSAADTLLQFLGTDQMLTVNLTDHAVTPPNESTPLPAYATRISVRPNTP